MIERVTIENFRSIAKVDVELGPISVLVGRNGAGKSTFIDVLRLIRDALRFNLETAIDTRGGISSLCRWVSAGRPNDIQIGLSASWDLAYEAEYKILIASTPMTGFKVKSESAMVTFPDYENLSPNPYKPSTIRQVLNGPNEIRLKEGRWVIGGTPSFSELNFNGSKDFEVNRRSLQLPTQTQYNTSLNLLLRHLQDTSFYTIFPNTLREPQKPSSEAVLSDNGQNLGSALKEIASQRVWKPDLLATLNKLVGDIVDVRVRMVGGYLVTELKHKSDPKRDKWFNLSQESDGTLRMLGLLVALYQDPPPTLIAIEEPELTIHPGALAVLGDLLREASARTQILITTQSPDLISCFKADELRVVERVNGTTEIGMIDEHQRSAIEAHLFAGGELLRIEGLKRRVPAGVAHGA